MDRTEPHAVAHLKKRIGEATKLAPGFVNEAMVEKIALAEVAIWMYSQSPEASSDSVRHVANVVTRWIFDGKPQ